MDKTYYNPVLIEGVFKEILKEYDRRLEVTELHRKADKQRIKVLEDSLKSIHIKLSQQHRDNLERNIQIKSNTEAIQRLARKINRTPTGYEDYGNAGLVTAYQQAVETHHPNAGLIRIELERRLDRVVDLD